MGTRVLLRAACASAAACCRTFPTFPRASTRSLPPTVTPCARTEASTHAHKDAHAHTHSHVHTHIHSRVHTHTSARAHRPRHAIRLPSAHAGLRRPFFRWAGRALLRPFEPLAAVALRSSTNGAHDRRSGVNSAHNSGSEPHCRTAVGVPSILRALCIAVVRRDCDRWRPTVRPTARTDDRTASLAVDGRAPAPCELRPS